jgi:hypothetical protein
MIFSLSAAVFFRLPGIRRTDSFRVDVLKTGKIEGLAISVLRFRENRQVKI